MSSFKWRDNHITKFLELYQSEECIWNIRSEDYKNVIMREKSYEKIRSGLEIENLTINDIKNKIKSIRTTYKVELNKVLKANKSGAGIDDLYKPKLFWFAQADAFLRDISVARESQSNLVLRNTQNEDRSETATPNPELEVHTPKPDESLHLEEHQNHNIQSDILVTPSTKSQATTITKRVRQITPQSFPKKKRKVDNSIEQAMDKLQTISNQCKEPEVDEFDLFCKSLAYQLKKMPLERALACQEKLQSVISQERLCQIAATSVSSPYSQRSNSSIYSAPASPYPNSPPFQQYMSREPTQPVYSTVPSSYPNSPPFQQYTENTDTPTQDIISQALMDI